MQLRWANGCIAEALAGVVLHEPHLRGHRAAARARWLRPTMRHGCVLDDGLLALDLVVVLLVAKLVARLLPHLLVRLRVDVDLQ